MSQLVTIAEPQIKDKNAIFEVELRNGLSENWNRVPGLTVEGHRVSVSPEEYFYRYENPSWILCDWSKVEAELLSNPETQDESFEQQTLTFVRENGVRTYDPAQVLLAAEQMYAYIFRDEQLDAPELSWVTPRHLQILREMGTVMSLNRVELTGRISNVGPAWFFPLCSEKVFDLDELEAEKVDELYHSTFFNESRRVESVKAHAALGGRLVHGCQSSANQTGGCIVSYGTDIEAFTDELKSLRTEWMDRIRSI